MQTNFVLESAVPGTIVPAVNFDPICTNDPAWFLGGSGNIIYLNKLNWTNGLTDAPEWEFPSPGIGLTVSNSLSTASTGAPQPISGLYGGILLQPPPDRANSVQAGRVNGTNYLWTCRVVTVNNAGNNDAPVTNPADRLGVEWFKIQTTPTLTFADTGRFYDTVAPQGFYGGPISYYMPSLSVNTNGDMVVGFSGSSSNEFAGAYFSGKSRDGATPSQPIRFFAGKGPCWATRWGDYSATSLDPDGLTIWTIQEYAETGWGAGPPPFAYGTRIVAIKPCE